MPEPLDLLVDRVNASWKRWQSLQVTAGQTLLELKSRITDKASPEGEPWAWRWQAFVRAKLDLSYSQTQRLIGYAKSDDPEKAVEEYRTKNAAQMRDARAQEAQPIKFAAEENSHTCANEPNNFTEFAPEVVGEATPLQRAKDAYLALRGDEIKEFRVWLQTQGN